MKLAQKVASRVNELKAAGRLSDAQYSKAITDANRIYETGLKESQRSKSDVFKKGIASVGKIVVGTVGGLLTGGPAGAAAGFVGTAQSLSSGGTTPPVGLVDVATPPIVNPSTVPAQAQSTQTPPAGFILAAWAVMLWVIFKKVLK